MKPERPDTLNSKTYKVPTGHGNLYIIVSENEEGQPLEVFALIGKCGGSTMAKAEVTGRMVSLALRHGIPLEDIVKQLIDIGGGEPRGWKKTVIKSIPDGVATILKRYYLNKDNSDD